MAVLDIKLLYSLFLNIFNPSLCLMMPTAKVTCLSDQVKEQNLMFEMQTSFTCSRSLENVLFDPRPVMPSLEDPGP